MPGVVVAHRKVTRLALRGFMVLIQAKEIRKIKDQIADIMAAHTGQDRKKILADSDRDY